MLRGTDSRNNSTEEGHGKSNDQSTDHGCANRVVGIGRL